MGDEQEWKFLLGDIYGEEKIEVGIVSERWRISDDEIMYPTNVAGAKWEMLIRMHTAPDLTSSDWLKYPFKLKKVCCKSRIVLLLSRVVVNKFYLYSYLGCRQGIRGPLLGRRRIRAQH